MACPKQRRERIQHHPSRPPMLPCQQGRTLPPHLHSINEYSRVYAEHLRRPRPKRRNGITPELSALQFGSASMVGNLFCAIPRLTSHRYAQKRHLQQPRRRCWLGTPFRPSHQASEHESICGRVASRLSPFNATAIGDQHATTSSMVCVG